MVLYRFFVFTSVFALTMINLSVADLFFSLSLCFFSTALIVVLAYKESNDWKSPCVLIPSVFLIYCFVFPIYFSLGGDRILGVFYSSVVFSADANCLFLMGICFGYCLSPIVKNNGLINKLSYTFYQVNNVSVNAVFFFFLVAYSYSFYQLGAAVGMGKEERMTTGAVSFGVFFGGIYVCIIYKMIYEFVKNSKNFSFGYLVICVGAIGFYFFGERDQFVVPILVLYISRSYFVKTNIKQNFIIAGLVLLVFFAMEVYRSYGESGVLRDVSSFVLILQENEFISAGRNLSMLHSFQSWHLNGETIIGDFLYPFFINNFPTGLVWFGSNYIENKGLSIVAEAWLNFGMSGVLLFGFLYGYLMMILYNYSFRSNFMTMLYIIILIAALYSLRSDFAAITSAIVRKFSIPVLFVLLLNYIMGCRVLRIKWKPL